LFSAAEVDKDQKGERWNFDDERVLLQQWADNLEKVESKDSRKTWQNIAKSLNEKRELQKINTLNRYHFISIMSHTCNPHNHHPFKTSEKVVFNAAGTVPQISSLHTYYIISLTDYTFYTYYKFITLLSITHISQAFCPCDPLNLFINSTTAG